MIDATVCVRMIVSWTRTREMRIVKGDGKILAENTVKRELARQRGGNS